MYVAGRTQTYFTIPKTIVIFLHNQWFAPFTWKHMNGALIIFAPPATRSRAKIVYLRCNGRQTFLFSRPGSCTPIYNIQNHYEYNQKHGCDTRQATAKMDGGGTSRRFHRSHHRPPQQRIYPRPLEGPRMAHGIRRFCWHSRGAGGRRRGALDRLALFPASRRTAQRHAI